MNWNNQLGWTRGEAVVIQLGIIFVSVATGMAIAQAILGH